jgi:hypothetical protein
MPADLLAGGFAVPPWVQSRIAEHDGYVLVSKRGAGAEFVHEHS